MSHITNPPDLDVTSRLIDYYEERFGDLILKSSFTVNLMKDGFVLPNGTVVKTGQWCHNHIAYQYIEQYTNERNEKLRKTKSAIERLESQGELNEQDQYFLNKLKTDLAVIESTQNYLELFNQVSKSKGIDPAEFVVIYFGFLGISDHYLIYNKRNVNSTQIRKVGCDYDYEGESRIIINK